jgi:dienelactone hydrolase
VHRLVTRPLDWFSIQLARLSVAGGPAWQGDAAEAEKRLHAPDFFGDPVRAPRDLTFVTDRDFRFSSPIQSPWGRNNTVHGRLFRSAPDWQNKPTVVLVHGWNAETGYRVLYPYLAWRLVRAGVNTAMLELPYHSQRKPRGDDAIRNFLSADLVHVVGATQQAIADTRSLVAWLLAQGCPRVGLWGISLGAWLTGLIACADERLDFAVLQTPVARIDRVIDELEFCRAIRASLDGAAIRLDRLNLATHRPRLSPENVLIVACQHDLFAPAETIEELWRAWNKPVIWRTRHGHISVLMSAPIMERIVDWIARRA